MSAARRRQSGRVGGEDRSPWAILKRALYRIVRDEALADEVLFAALGTSGLPHPPQSTMDVLAFAGVHLAPALAEALGHTRATEFLSSLQLELAPPRTSEPVPVAPGDDETRRHSDIRQRAIAGPPSPSSEPYRKKQPSISGEEGRAIVLLVQSNALKRGELARALVREGFDVRAIETTRELSGALLARESPTLAMLEVDRDGSPETLRAIAEAYPDAPLVLSAESRELALDAAAAVAMRVLHVHARGSPLRDIVDRVKKYAGAPPVPFEEPTSDPHLLAAAQAPTTVRPPQRASGARVPRVAISQDDVFWFGLDADAMKILLCVDGASTIDAIAERCGRSATDVAAILDELSQAQIVRFD